MLSVLVVFFIAYQNKIVEYGLESILFGRNWTLDRVLSKKLELRIIIAFYLFSYLFFLILRFGMFLEIYKFTVS